MHTKQPVHLASPKLYDQDIGREGTGRYLEYCHRAKFALSHYRYIFKLFLIAAADGITVSDSISNNETCAADLPDHVDRHYSNV